MGKREARMKSLLEVIGKQNGITIKALSGLEGVSELTIRRDIQVMEQKRLVRNVRGTIFCNYDEAADSSYLLSVATHKNQKEKRRIGAFAAKLIQPGESIIIDNGSTMECLAASIPASADITVLCYNMNVLHHLYQKPNMNLIFCGGNFHHQTLMFECPESLEIIRRTRAGKVFVSAVGVHETMGVTCVDEYELPSKREIIKAGVERILLVDSSKFGKLGTCFIGELNVFQRIVTDTGLSPQWAELIRDKGIELDLV